MSFARISPESVQKTCANVTRVPHTVIYLHGDNSFAASDSTPLSFRVKLGVGPQYLWVLSQLLSTTRSGIWIQYQVRNDKKNTFSVNHI